MNKFFLMTSHHHLLPLLPTFHPLKHNFLQPTKLQYIDRDAEIEAEAVHNSYQQC